MIDQMAIFEIYKDLSKHYRYRLTGDDGPILLFGYGHSMKERVLKDIESVRRNVLIDDRYERKLDLDNYSFVLKRSNGDAIGRSQDFADVRLRESCIDRLKSNVLSARVIES